jgi:FkbM family methyltransferase
MGQRGAPHRRGAPVARGRLVPISRYALKRALLAPWRLYQRRREPSRDPVARSMLELHSYSRALYAFMAATAEKPDLLTDSELDERSVVLDLGAYDGAWSRAIVDRYQAHVYAFEPDPISFRKLEQRREAPRIVAFDYGLSAADGTAEIGLAGPGSSIYTSEGLFGTASVRIRDVVTVLEELGLESVDLLKVNIEGAEYDLFDRLVAADWLGRIRQVSVQFHEWHPHAHRRRNAIRRALRVTHDEVWNYPWVWELWRRKRYGAGSPAS